MRFLLLLLVVAAVAWQFPQAVNVVADLTGMTDSDACSAIESYLQHLGDGAVADADGYKVAGDTFPEWVNGIDGVKTVECTCSEDLSDKHITNIADVPDSLANVTGAELVTFTLNGTYNGEPAEMEGGALAFQLLSPDWYVTQEGYQRLNGEETGSLNIAQFSSTCSL